MTRPILSDLKPDMLEMIALSAEIGKYHQMLLQHNDMVDKRNFDPKRCDLILKKITELESRFYYLKKKWFGD